MKEKADIVLISVAYVDRRACLCSLFTGLSTLESPAIQFFTDFSQVQSQVIEVSASAVDARKVIIRTHVNDSHSSLIGG